MARLPWLFQTRSFVHNKNNPIAADIILSGIILGDCLFYYIENGMFCGDSNEKTQNTFMLEKFETTIPIMFPIQAL